MNYSHVNNVWNFISDPFAAAADYLDCEIITKDGKLKSNRLFMMCFGSKMILPECGQGME